MLAILPKRPFLSKNCAKLLIYFDMCKKKRTFATVFTNLKNPHNKNAIFNQKSFCS